MTQVTWMPRPPGECEVRWHRVRELREAIQKGRYRVAAVDVAGKLMQTLRDNTLHPRRR